MIVAITAQGPSMDAPIEARFGRAPYYVFVDTETMNFDAIQNPNMAAGGGAGIQSAQLMADRNVKYILTGNCGPNAFRVFGAAGVQVIVGVSGRVGDAVSRFKAGEFNVASQPNVESHFGMGGGTGMGRGMGGGMGMGRGMGMNRGAAIIDTADATPSKPETHSNDETAMLKEKARILEEQLKELQKKIDEADEKE